MDQMNSRNCWDAYKSGNLDSRDAVERIKNLHFEDIGFARVDHSRAARLFPEVVFGGGKTRADRRYRRTPRAALA